MCFDNALLKKKINKINMRKTAMIFITIVPFAGYFQLVDNRVLTRNLASKKMSK